MNRYRPNVSERRPQNDWCDSRDETFDAMKLRPSTESESPLRCETPPEFCMYVGLWSALREIDSVPGKLLVQHQVGRCHLDLALVGNGTKIDIEVDGESFHRQRIEQDQRRDGWLVRQGWTVMRYSAHDVMISREYVRWAGLDICSFYLGQKTLEEIRAGSAGFEAELADHYPHLVVPVGVCVACRGTGKCEGLCTTRLRGL